MRFRKTKSDSTVCYQCCMWSSAQLLLLEYRRVSLSTVVLIYKSIAFFFALIISYHSVGLEYKTNFTFCTNQKKRTRPVMCYVYSAVWTAERRRIHELWKSIEIASWYTVAGTEHSTVHTVITYRTKCGSYFFFYYFLLLPFIFTSFFPICLSVSVYVSIFLSVLLYFRLLPPFSFISSPT